MIDKQLLTTPILAAAWDRNPKSNSASSKRVTVPGNTTHRSTAASTQK